MTAASAELQHGLLQEHFDRSSGDHQVTKQSLLRDYTLKLP